MISLRRTICHSRTKSLDAIASEYKVPAKYAGYQAAEARVKSNVQVIADELKKK